MRELSSGAVGEIAVVGAHCDDIPIGMGGTLLSLCADEPGLRVHALVLSGGGTERESEERAALDAFCPGATTHVTVLNIPDGQTPAHWQAVKTALHEFRQTCNPAIIFGPQRHDAHQDHRLLAELLPTEFRDHLALGYEILKWETDTPQPSVFVPLAVGVAEEKARLLCKYYPSQVMHDWFDEEAFLGLSRLRGVQCRSRHAEAFTAEKISLRFGGR